MAVPCPTTWTQLRCPVPHQPYNATRTCIPRAGAVADHRAGRWSIRSRARQHVRVLAVTGICAGKEPAQSRPADPAHALQPLLFTTTTTPGQAMDRHLQWTGKASLDVFGHGYAATPHLRPRATATTRAIRRRPTTTMVRRSQEAAESSRRHVGKWRPGTLPDPNIVANGPGMPAVLPQRGSDDPRGLAARRLPPSGVCEQSDPIEAGFAFMCTRITSARSPEQSFPADAMMMSLSIHVHT